MPGFFLFANSSGSFCLSVCPSGLKPDHSSNKCVTSLVNISQAQSATLTAAPLTTSLALTVSSVASGGFSINMMMCLVATESIANMKYLNIDHSNIASTIYDGMSSSYVPNWISRFNILEKEAIIFNWGIFHKNEISALFFDNFGDSLTEFMIYLGLFLLSVFITFTPKAKKLMGSFSEKAYITTFSFLVANIFGKIQSQILFSILQIIKTSFKFDVYSSLSLFTAISTTLVVLIVMVVCFFKLKKIFNYQGHSRNAIPCNHNSDRAILECKWLEKKYEFLIGDFKDSNKNQFFFAYWITAFNSVYILLIFSLQNFPILQCLSIMVLVGAFIAFSAKIKPFKSRAPAFLHFFNFGCVLVIAILNLGLAFATTGNRHFSNAESQGLVVISVIAINTITNTLFSLIGMILEIYHKIKLSRQSKNRGTMKVKSTNIDTASQESRINQTQGLTKTNSGQPSRWTIYPNEESDPNISRSGLINDTSLYPSNNTAPNITIFLHNNYFSTASDSSPGLGVKQTLKVVRSKRKVRGQFRAHNNEPKNTDTE